MKPSRLGVLFLSLPFLGVCGCNGGGGGPVGDPPPASRLMVTTSTAVLEPSTAPAPAADLGRLGVHRVEANYRVTTPADTPFSFDLVSWRQGATGLATVSVAHAGDGGAPPADALSLPAAGVLVQGNGLSIREDWFQASGDGFVRMTLSGRITRSQVIAVQADTDAATVIAIDIGPHSDINRPGSGDPDDAGVVSRQTIYSSDSPFFGLPTVAVSGDRTSVVAYEGDRGSDPTHRYEMRLQHAAATGAVTGGGSFETSLDTGYWRDHEIAALYNVLAVVRADANGVGVRLSFDRGATFAQVVELPVSMVQSRLVQIAMALDYSLAIAFWNVVTEPSGQQALQLQLVEGSATAFDGTGSPTWFTFGAPQALHTVPLNATPLTTGIAWSEGGDLVVGHGATWFEPGSGFTWRNVTEFRCATRRHGEPVNDQLVERNEVFGMDPTVAVLGQGSSMRIFYAYEGQTGVRLAVSENGGDTFTFATEFGQLGDHLPSVFAREVDGKTRVDVVYLASREQGTELHRSRWLDWPASPREDEQLTKAETTFGQIDPAICSWPPVHCTQIGWLGYDAVLDGDEIVVAYDEATTDSYWCFYGMWAGRQVSTTGGISIPIFAPATPPPLAPGMTQPMPPVNPDHAHQLVLLRLR